MKKIVLAAAVVLGMTTNTFASGSHHGGYHHGPTLPGQSKKNNDAVIGVAIGLAVLGLIGMIALSKKNDDCEKDSKNKIRCSNEE